MDKFATIMRKDCVNVIILRGNLSFYLHSSNKLGNTTLINYIGVRGGGGGGAGGLQPP